MVMDLILLMVFLVNIVILDVIVRKKCLRCMKS